MFLDNLLVVSDAQAVTASAVSTNSIDLGLPGGIGTPPKREIGTGEAMGFGVQIDVAADFTTGDETYQIEVISATDAALTAGILVHATYVRTAAQLALGALLFCPVPMGFPTQRFLGLRYVTGGTTPSVTLTAWLTSHALFSLNAKSYAKNFIV